LLKKVIIVGILVIAVILSGCKSSQKEKLPPPDTQTTPFIYASLPPFHTIFEILDYLKLGDYDQAVPTKVYRTKQETGHAAFALGVLTADGIISVRGHNKSKLNAIAEEMIRLSNFLGLDESILRLADQLKELVNNDQWEELEKALEYYKSEVEGSLYQSQQYDQFTLMQLGGWIEGTNRVAWFVSRNYQKDKTKVLNQQGTLNHLISNMEYINTPSIQSASYFKPSYEKLLQIKRIIDKPVDNTYSREQVEQLISLTADIKKIFGS